MKLLLKRIARKTDYTIGKLYIDGIYFCDTLEDTDRKLTQTTPLFEINKIKVKSKTAIPTGTYKVTLLILSPKYKLRPTWFKYNLGYMPRLLDVPGYEGILIHSGNTNKDTDGCILVGRNTVVGLVTDSINTFKKLYSRLKDNKDNITIEII